MIGGRLRPQLFKITDQAVIGRVHCAINLGLRAGQQFIAGCPIEILDLVQLLSKGCVQDILFGGRSTEVSHLHDHFFDDKGRRDDALFLPQIQVFEQLIELGIEFGQAGNVMPGIALVTHVMNRRHEIGQAVLYAK